MERVIVVGAGVVGLSCALRLLEAGHRVDVLARDLPLETTSSVAAAIWYPYLAFPQDRVAAWSATTYAELERLASVDGTGVRMREGTEVFAATTPDPWWAGAVPSLHRVEAPAAYADAWSFVTPVVEMPTYLSWLAGRVCDAGGTLTRMALAELPTTGLVVNCSGLGARRLAADETVRPVRGQVVVVEQIGLERWWLDSSDGGSDAGDGSHQPTYVVPRSRDIILGGTEHPGQWSRTPDPGTAAAILARTTALVPELARARVLRHKVGLRPARPAVRLERVGDVVHCYGQGGAGVTVSWGCADEVAGLVAG